MLSDVTSGDDAGDTMISVDDHLSCSGTSCKRWGGKGVEEGVGDREGSVWDRVRKGVERVMMPVTR